MASSRTCPTGAVVVGFDVVGCRCWAVWRRSCIGLSEPTWRCSSFIDLAVLVSSSRLTRYFVDPAYLRLNLSFV